MTTPINNSSQPSDLRSQISNVPTSVLQAIYHAVTGKTETYSKSLNKNVIIDFPSVENLHHQIMQQMEHYDLVSPPTITVVVQMEKKKKLQYSSWERFSLMQMNVTDITSAILLKYEFLIQIPKTLDPQRCVLNVTLDSGLLVVCRDDDVPPLLARGIYRMMTIPTAWRTVDISIDFVDFLVARNFASVVEEWFSHLPVLTKPKIAAFYHTHYHLITSIWHRSATLGLALFFLVFAAGRSSTSITLNDLMYAASIAILIWSILSIAIREVEDSFSTRISQCFIPSVILLTNGDRRAYEALLSPNPTIARSLRSVFWTSAMAIFLNIAASYIYAAMTR